MGLDETRTRLRGGQDVGRRPAHRAAGGRAVEGIFPDIVPDPLARHRQGACLQVGLLVGRLGRRQLLPRVDVGGCDRAPQDSRIADRAELELRLRNRRDDEEVLCRERYVRTRGDPSGR